MLDSSAQYIKGIGPYRYELLKRMGIITAEDLITYYPRDYLVLHNVKSIADIEPDTLVTVTGEIMRTKINRRKPWRPVISAAAADETASIEVVWFNQPYVAEQLVEGAAIIMTGRARMYKGALQMVNPQFEVFEEDVPALAAGGTILPVYPLTEGITQKLMRRVMKNALEKYLPEVADMFPSKYFKNLSLLPIRKALQNVHFPASEDLLNAARRRLIYDEFFLLETALALRRRDIKKMTKDFSYRFSDKIDKRIRRLFPFTLTAEQDKVIAEILADLARLEPMNRLLQGDVGSGKTVVAIYAALLAIASGLQAAFMAPTEILAEQHYKTLASYLQKAQVTFKLLTSGTPPVRRAEILAGTRDGSIDLVIGTHALIQKDVRFHKLGLLVIDEQHKFGVIQRTALRQKGLNPDCLVMTATPIPRTLMLTVFGDLDVSVIAKLPPGRKRIITRFVHENEVEKVYPFIRKTVENGRQVYFVYPLIEESEKLDIKAAATMYEHLKREVFPTFSVGLVHGKMPTQEKEKVMRDFRKGAIDILVSTVVIEVGIDVPNATVMVIEHADRFGLAQLHQLRGRIGRSTMQSYCILVGEPVTESAQARVNILTQTSDGFKISEEDLKLRGPGEIFGTRQHGLPELKIGNIAEDYDLLKLARRDAFKLVNKDPDLSQQSHQKVRQRVIELYKDKLDLVSIG